MPRIKTTVVGSYPVPDWLVASPSEQALMDATRVVIDIQEQAGVDVVCDGELYRFDINHPETNGMIEYFVKPMDGITPALLVRRPDRLPLQQRHEVPHPAARHGGRPDRARQPRPAAGLLARQGAGHTTPSSSPSPARTCWPRR